MNVIISKLVNNLIQSYLPKINRTLTERVKKNGFDPLIEVTGGQKIVGSLPMGITTASAVFHYKINNLVGLSSTEITKLTISSSEATIKNKDLLSGSVTLEAKLEEQLSVDLAGKLVVRPAFPGTSQNISGTVSFNKIILNATGTFSVSMKLGSVKPRLKMLHINTIDVSYAEEKISLSKLGIFTPLKVPIAALLKSETRKIISQIGSYQMRDLLNIELAKLCNL